jgi:hypothetical protein
MEWLLALVLLGIIAWLLTEEDLGMPVDIVPRKRLCDYYASGGVYEDLGDVLRRGSRLYEVHVYSDEQDQPVVSKHPQNDGYDYAEDNTTFEKVCVDLVNDAFPSKDPFILSIVLHSEKSIVANRVADHLKTTVRRRLLKTEKDITQVPIDALANKLILVSGGNVRGTELEPLINLFWTDMNFRRLSWHEAAHPRDEPELLAFNKDHITLVAPHAELRMKNAHPSRPKVFGCQWNLFDQSGGGFVEKPNTLRGKTLLTE